MEVKILTELHRGRQSPSNLGRVLFAGSIHAGRGVLPKRPMRVYDSYAIVLITAGRGRYLDSNGFERRIIAGDLIYVFPGLAHAYGPDDGTTWDEYYIVFEGQTADSLVEWNVISAAKPIVSLGDPAMWLKKMAAVVEYVSTSSTEAGLFKLCVLLAEVAEQVIDRAADSEPTGWVGLACRRLSNDLGEAISLEGLATDCGLGYSSFRSRFRELVGSSPAQFRNRRRIDAAKDLLKFTSSTLTEIAVQVGYSDQYHFSKQFKLLARISPSEYRKQVSGSLARHEHFNAVAKQGETVLK